MEGWRLDPENLRPASFECEGDRHFGQYLPAGEQAREQNMSCRDQQYARVASKNCGKPV
jgi:hypothetical protein